MVDHIRTLLLNPSGIYGYRHVKEDAVDRTLALFGITGATYNDEKRIDMLLPLVYAEDLSAFRVFFDKRVTPAKASSVYRTPTYELIPEGMAVKVLSQDGMWVVSSLFQSDDNEILSVLLSMRAAAASKDVAFALGAILIACAYRRLLLQKGDM